MRYFVKIESVYGPLIFNFENYTQLRNFVYCNVTVFDCNICKIYDVTNEVYINEESVYMDYIEENPL